MKSAFRRLRPLWISLVVLILTAGIAFAAKPSTPANSHPGAQTTETETTETTETDESTETTEKVDTTETVETTETSGSTSGDHCATDPTNLLPEQLALLNHGAIVCWAAHQPTPAGYANHGAWVSHWAHMGTHGKSAAHAPAH